ncbi:MULTISPECIES: nitroreductase family protein [unclassified Pseudonocardia]|uniref:nitroreductase family protein n=1 Tax=unclassified Pseudonocardia TaxID=2619320 RepID=UPI001CF61FDE|nr:nitroreductase family protein [Pseudonocardia sp. ICBG601]
MDDTPRLHPLLSRRFSPLLFDEDHQVSDDEVALLIEAARWAPSAGNSQPWSFVAGRRGDDTHRRIVRHVLGASRDWAPTAAVLVVNLCHVLVEETDWEYSEFALYDLGQAVAHMTVQAAALGLATRQFRAFDRDGLAAEFDVPGHWQVTTVSAFGRGAGRRPERERRASAELRWSDRHLRIEPRG